jgi:ligand-binding sensor domain-containing protein
MHIQPNFSIFYSKIKYILGILYLFYGISSECIGQALAPRKIYTVADGLPSNVIYRCIQDSKKRLWFCTDAGVARFDGKQFDIFDMDSGLSDNEVFNVMEDSHKRLWFSTFNGKPLYYDLEKERFFNVYNDTTLAKATIPGITSTVIEDHYGNIWYGGGNDNIFICIQPNGTVNRFPKLKFISAFLDNERNFCLINGEGVLKYVPERNTFEPSDQLPDYTGVRFTYSDTTGLYYPSTMGLNRLYKHKITAWATNKELFDKPLITFNRDKKGNFVYGVRDGVIYHDVKKNTFNFQYTGFQMTSFLEDNEHNIWIASKGGGVYFYPSYHNDITYYNSPVSLKQNTVNNVILKDKNTTIYSSFPSSLNLIEGKKERRINFSKENNPVTFLKMMPYKNDLWILSEREFMVLPNYQKQFTENDKTISVQSLPQNMATKTYSSTKYTFNLYKNAIISLPAKNFLYSPSQKRIYFAEQVCLSVLDLRNYPTACRYDTITRHPSRIYALAEDAAHKIWYGGLPTIGLCSYDATTKEIKHYEPKIQAVIKEIIPLANNYLLLGTEGLGLFLVRSDNPNHVIKRWTTKDGLSSNLCRRIFKESNQSVWLATNMGVTNLTFQDTVAYSQISTNVYGTTQGLPSADVNDVYFKDGQLGVATSNGLVTFDKAILTRKNEKIAFEELSILVNDMLEKDYHFGMELDPSDNRLLFKLKNVLFQNADKIKYRFRLFHYNNWQFINTWFIKERNLIASSINDTRQMSINSLPAGDYALEIEYRLEGEGSEWQPLQNCRFQKNAPIGAHPLMVVLYFGLFFWLVKLGNRWYVNRIQEQEAKKHREESERLAMEQEKTEIQQLLTKAERDIAQLDQELAQVQLSPHFIFNSLTNLQSLIGREGYEQTLERQLVGLAKLIRQSLELTDSDFINVEEELSFLKKYLSLEQMRFRDKLDYDVSDFVIDEKVLSSKHELPPLMLQIFIENAIKHGIKPLPSKQKGRLTIRFYFDAEDANLLICSVENNGLSLEAAQEVKAKMVALEQVGRQKSRGLDITQRRIAALNTKYGIEIKMDGPYNRAEGTGTVVRLIVPQR